MKQISEETKKDIRKLAADMYALLMRVCEETGVKTDADSHLASMLVNSEIQNELVRLIQDDERADAEAAKQ